MLMPHSILDAPAGQRLAMGVGAGLIGLSALVLLGWVMDIEILTRLSPDFPTMKVNTALGFALCGVALLTLFAPVAAFNKPLLPLIASMLLAAGSVLTLLEYWLGLNTGFDQWLLQDHVSLDMPGRPSEMTAFVFLVAAVLLLQLSSSQHGRRDVWLFVLISLLGVAPALVGVFGYLYQPESLLRVQAFSTMALHTCLAFLAFFISLLLASPDSPLQRVIWRQTAGGQLFRRLFFPILVFPLLAGWVLKSLVLSERLPLVMSIAVFVLLTGLVSLGALYVSAIRLDVWSLRLQEEMAAKLLAETKLALVWDSSQTAVLLLDVHGRVMEGNRGACRLFGLDAGKLRHCTLNELIPAVADEEALAGLRAFIADDQQEWWSLDDPARVRAQTRSGEQVPIVAAISKHRHNRELLIGVVIMRVPTLAATIDRLRDDSLRDALTGVGNRKSLDARLQRITQYGVRHEGQMLGLIMLDIDHFKQVNDRFGHGVGDQVLQEFALRVSSALRENDHLYRYGGEEFVALVWFRHPVELVRVACRIRQQLVQAPLLRDPLVYVTCSMGIAAITRDTTDVALVLEQADAALYRAKTNGRDNFVLTAELLPEYEPSATACAGDVQNH